MREAIAEETNTVGQEFNKVALDLLVASAEELFDSYKCTISRREITGASVPGQEVNLGAACGFTGEFVRGMLAIAIDDQLASVINPVANGAKDANYDWIGELANQLLGRLKNKLLSWNVEVALSTPVVVHGAQLSIASLQRKAEQIDFNANESSTISVWWDAEVDPALELTQENAPEVQAEGEMVLF